MDGGNSRISGVKDLEWYIDFRKPAAPVVKERSEGAHDDGDVQIAFQCGGGGDNGAFTRTCG